MDLRLSLRIIAPVLMMVIQFASGSFVFNVTHKFAGKDKQLSELKSHDTFRHARMLANVDLPLGGDSRADSIGLYFTKIELGSPAKHYHVQVDTGSDILWVNCAPCSKCPVKTDLGVMFLFLFLFCNFFFSFFILSCFVLLCGADTSVVVRLKSFLDFQESFVRR